MHRPAIGIRRLPGTKRPRSESAGDLKSREGVAIDPSSAVSFRAGKALKDMLN